MNGSKPVFVSAILLSVLSGITISQVFNVMATDGGGNPFTVIWEAISELQSTVNILEDRVETLEEQSLPQGFINAPAYDSGWVSTNGFMYHTFEHGLNTTNVLVYVMRNDTTKGINQIWIYQQNWDTLQWYNLTDNDITLLTENPGPYVEIRVMIWKISD